MLNTSKLIELMETKDIKSFLDLSKKTNVPLSTIYSMLNRNNMNVNSVFELGKFFGVGVDELINTGYEYVVISEDEEIHTKCMNIYEVTMKNMM